MKIRTDFVTNSSSSSFILEIQVIGKDGKTASFDTKCCFEEGDFDVDVENSYKGNKKSLTTINSIEKLCEKLLAGAGAFDCSEELAYENSHIYCDECGSEISKDELIITKEEDIFLCPECESEIYFDESETLDSCIEKFRLQMKKIKSTDNIKSIKFYRNWYASGECSASIYDEELQDSCEAYKKSPNEETKTNLIKALNKIKPREGGFASYNTNVIYNWSAKNDKELLELVNDILSGKAINRANEDGSYECEDLDMSTGKIKRYGVYNFNGGRNIDSALEQIDDMDYSSKLSDKLKNGKTISKKQDKKIINNVEEITPEEELQTEKIYKEECIRIADERMKTNKPGYGFLALMMTVLSTSGCFDAAVHFVLEKIIISKEVENILGTDLKSLLVGYEKKSTQMLADCIRELKDNADMKLIDSYFEKIKAAFPENINELNCLADAVSQAVKNR